MLSREQVASEKGSPSAYAGLGHRDTFGGTTVSPLRAPSRHGGAQCRWQCSKNDEQRGFLQTSGAVRIGHRERFGSTTGGSVAKRLSIQMFGGMTGSSCGHRLVTVVAVASTVLSRWGEVPLAVQRAG